MNPFSLLVKPVGGTCNLNCDYCFYKEHRGGKMSVETMDQLFSSYAALPFPAKAIALQGGEPLLAWDTGIFQRLAAFPVDKSLQTNATLVTEEIAETLKRDNWLVGASLDGPRELNRLRGDSYEAIVAGIRRLEQADVAYNLLSVVSQANVRHPREVYRFLRDNFQTNFLQFIECTGPRDEIDGESWGDFLIGVFDEWIKEDARKVSIRLFDSIVSQMVLGRPTQCSFDRTCRQYLVIEHDGSVYPCDFHVREDLRLGNIHTHTFRELVDAPLYARFAAAKTENLPKACRDCPYLSFCNGDCPRNHGLLCAGWKRFFAHALPRFEELVQDL